MPPAHGGGSNHLGGGGGGFAAPDSEDAWLLEGSLDPDKAGGEPRRLYRTRWWVCILFSWVAMTQGAAWNMYGPIQVGGCCSTAPVLLP